MRAARAWFLLLGGGWGRWRARGVVVVLVAGLAGLAGSLVVLVGVDSWWRGLRMPLFLFFWVGLDDGEVLMIVFCVFFLRLLFLGGRVFDAGDRRSCSIVYVCGLGGSGLHKVESICAPAGT